MEYVLVALFVVLIGGILNKIHRQDEKIRVLERLAKLRS